jgi:hypothetical protein
MPFRFYLPSAAVAPREILPAVSWKVGRPYVERYATLSPSALNQLPRACKRLWLVSSHQGKNDGTPGGLAHYERYLALNRSLGDRYADSVTWTFGRARIISVALFGPVQP